MQFRQDSQQLPSPRAATGMFDVILADLGIRSFARPLLNVRQLR